MQEKKTRQTITKAHKLQIRQLRAGGEDYLGIAGKVGVSVSTVARVLQKSRGRLPPQTTTPTAAPPPERQGGELAALRKENATLRAALKGLLG